MSRAHGRLAGLALLLPLVAVSCGAPAEREPAPPASWFASATAPSARAPLPLSPAAEVEPRSKEPRVLDLAAALEIAGAESLLIALAREELGETQARLDEAEALWLPDLRAGVAYDRHEGNVQDTAGDILDVTKSSGYLGVGVFAAFDLADALLERKPREREMEAAEAGLAARVDEVLLAVALVHTELVEAQAQRALAQEALADAEDLAELAAAFVTAGEGLEADAARTRREVAARRRALAAADELVATRSVRLASLLHLDPARPLRAAEQHLVPFVLVPQDETLEVQLERALASRPELASYAALARAGQERERQEELRPFLPELRLGLAGGTFGGGAGSDFGDFAERGDLAVSLTWNLRNLGLGEGATRRTQASLRRQAEIRLALAREQVLEEVSLAHAQAREGPRQIESAAVDVAESARALALDRRRLEGGEGLPIEALQSLRALAEAREAELDAIAAFDRAQLRLLHAVGRRPGT